MENENEIIVWIGGSPYAIEISNDETKRLVDELNYAQSELNRIKEYYDKIQVLSSILYGNYVKEHNALPPLKYPSQSNHSQKSSKKNK